MSNIERLFILISNLKSKYLCKRPSLDDSYRRSITYIVKTMLSKFASTLFMVDLLVNDIYRALTSQTISVRANIQKNR
jgi:hypothetical protein